MYDLAVIQRMNREAVAAHEEKASNMGVDQKKIDEAIATLREAGYAVNIWTDDDIVYVLNDVIENTDGIERSEAEVQRIIQEVKKSPEWESLQEADEWQWELISYAVEDALALD